LCRGGAGLTKLSQNTSVLVSKRLGAYASLSGKAVKQPQPAARNHKVKLSVANVAAYIGRHHNHPFSLNSPVIVICAMFARAGKRYLVARTALIGRVCGHEAVSQIIVDSERNHIPASVGITPLATAPVVIACRH
jgi:hypothetical protein